MGSASPKATQRCIKAYYETLKQYEGQAVSHETAVRSAFQTLLADMAKSRHWVLVPELPSEGPGRTLIRPDGTLRDDFLIPRGYWEAKDSADDLDAEITKKIAKGYPLSNIIFEDTRTGVLYQDAREALRVDLRDPRQLTDLLNAFFTYSEPNIDQFEKAVDEFKERVPELAKGLTAKIAEAHRDNGRFKGAFASFFEVCKASLNPNLSQAAVDEMLVQHLLTERLFRTIFADSDFTRRNVVAAEVEKVVAALVSKSFNRAEFLKGLDRFYIAIEDAARAIDDFTDKQHFLNTVYERFFQGYSVKVADTHGIVYTPQPIVDFMCASVAEVLETEFGKPLGSPGVQILDPCTGTGNFVVNLLRRIPKQALSRVYRGQLFANEVMLLPYYIASLNIEHAYYELTGQYEPFEGLCFVDTLDMAEHAQSEFGFMTEENTERVKRQKAAPITVIIGNPPYNVGQLNENDNNKNRKYPVIDQRIHDTYAADSKATLKNQLYDAYVKFFRWATDRLEDRDGIVCFVSNNSFVDQLAFDGMRKHLLADFTHIHHIDLHGNVRKNPKLSGTTHNVFGIQVGVGVTVAVRKRAQKPQNEPGLFYFRVPDLWRKEQKLEMLLKSGRAGRVEWNSLAADADYTWLVPEDANQFANFVPIGSKTAKATDASDVPTIFKTFSGGVKTNRDDVVYDFQRESLVQRTQQFIEDYNAEVDRWKRKREKSSVDDFVRCDKIKWDGTLKEHLVQGKYAEYIAERLRRVLYRPYTPRFLYFERLLVNSVYLQHRFFPALVSERENRAMALTDAGSEKPFMALCTAGVLDLHAVGAGASCQCFPFYVYDEDGTNRRENITDWALGQFREKYGKRRGKAAIEKWDIFYYVYGILHHPGYREKYADCLKRELPRIPFSPDFWAFADAGRELAHWHLDYEEVTPYELDFEVAEGKPLSYRVEDKMRLSKDKTALTVNPSLTLAGIPAETYEYRLGNRSALEWVVDQYQVKKDARSGVVSDPNRADDPEYIVRLAGQVVRVSLETVRIVKSLPQDFGG